MNPIGCCQPWMRLLWKEERCWGPAVLQDWEPLAELVMLCAAPSPRLRALSRVEVVMVMPGGNLRLGQRQSMRFQMNSRWIKLKLNSSAKELCQLSHQYLLKYHLPYIGDFAVSHLRGENNSTSLSLRMAFAWKLALHFDIKVMVITITPKRDRTIENHICGFFVPLTVSQYSPGMREEKTVTGHANWSACSDVCFDQGSF